MMIRVLICLLFLASCNVIETLTDGETKLDEDFFSRERHNSSLNDSLIISWNFNSYSNAYFDSRGGNDLDAQGGLSDPSVSGFTGNAVDCNSTSASNYLYTNSLSSELELGTAQDFSIAFRVFRINQAAATPVLFHADATNADIKIAQLATSDTLSVDVGGRNYSVPSAFVNSTWMSIVLRFDRDIGMEYCINGACSGPTGIASTSENISGAIQIFMCNGATLGPPIDGKIDGFAIWDRLLSNDEVNEYSSNITFLD